MTNDARQPFVIVTVAAICVVFHQLITAINDGELLVHSRLFMNQTRWCVEHKGKLPPLGDINSVFSYVRAHHPHMGMACDYRGFPAMYVALGWTTEQQSLGADAVTVCSGDYIPLSFAREHPSNPKMWNSTSIANIAWLSLHRNSSEDRQQFAAELAFMIQELRKTI